MKEKVTVIAVIRNRDPERIVNLATSIREHGADPSFLLVDYGSSEPLSQSYSEISARLGIRYERISSEGLPWNKCHAINCGVRLAKTEYIVTTDIDMLYVSDPIRYCLDHYSGKTSYHIYAHWLPKSGRADKAKFAGPGSPGGFQFVPASAFHEAGGYDESLKYWGQEDLDWPTRLRELGYGQEWLPEPHKMYHVWHESSERGYLRPATANYDTMNACLRNQFEPVLRQDWGRAWQESDRPILGIMKRENPLRMAFEANQFSKYGEIKAALDSRERGRFIKLDLGSRTIRRYLSRLAGPMYKLMRPVAALTGLSCSLRLNSNFDYLYAALPLFLERGLSDYYIAPDLSSVYLLWGDKRSKAKN
jgi:hypothetical protein